ncbi:MAG: hypothetical protein ACRD1K_05045 [Acidimicrobiales bacterium]
MTTKEDSIGRPLGLVGTLAPLSGRRCWAMSESRSAGPVVYIDRSDVHEDRWDELEAGIRVLVAFVQEHQPKMASYGFYLDEEAHQMTVVSVHPDSASLERHIDIGGPGFKKLAPFLALREIEVFGHLSERAAALVQQKAAVLGDGGVVTFHEQFVGFDRLNMPSQR